MALPPLPPTTTYDPKYFEPLFAAEERHFWFRSRNAILERIITRLVKAKPNGFRILEAGCGTGYVLRMLEKVCSKGLVAGMDLFSDGLRFAGRRVSVPLIQGDMLHPPFNDELDFICMFDVLEHLPDDLAILTSVHKLLRKEGRLLLTVPADPELWSYFDVASHHYRRYTLESLQSAMEKAGFEVDFISPYMMSIYPMVWLTRRLTGQGTAGLESDHALVEKKSMDELKIIPVINEILTLILSLEGAFLAAGKRLPAGTSLLAVGQKKA